MRKNDTFEKVRKLFTENPLITSKEVHNLLGIAIPTAIYHLRKKFLIYQLA